MITSLDQLSPATHAIANRLLDQAVAATEADLRAEVRLSLVSHLCEALSPDATADQIEHLIAGLGPINADPRGRGFLDRLLGGTPLSELGERIAETWWNPANEDLLVPRVLGWGWDLNFGAAAVRLGLIEPDAEAVPFSATPANAFALAALVPMATTGAIGLHYLVRGRRLGTKLPSHWDFAGRPDRWVPKRSAALTDLGTAAGVAVGAIWAATSSQPGPQRAGALAGATLAGGIAATTTLQRGFTRPRPWVSPLLLTATVGVVGAMLYGLAKAGRNAEIRHDLDQ
jgi:hypothetical protein